ncbi:MAG: ATP-binding cassette domain-containing protein, partial [Candidatus Thioglobus sp.]
MIEIKGLNQYYGESHTLWGLNLNVSEGDCISVMGRNGVGKTTLVESIMG